MFLEIAALCARPLSCHNDIRLANQHHKETSYTTILLGASGTHSFH